MKHRVHYTFPIAAYSCEKKELIGLFKSPVLVARYFFTDPIKSANVREALKKRSKMGTTVGKIAVRACNEYQKKQLGGKEFVILNNYPQPICKQMQGFVGLHERHDNKSMNF